MLAGVVRETKEAGAQGERDRVVMQIWISKEQLTWIRQRQKCSSTIHQVRSASGCGMRVLRIRIRAESLDPTGGLCRERVLPDGRGRPGAAHLIRSWQIGHMYLRTEIAFVSQFDEDVIQQSRRRLEGIMCPEGYRLFRSGTYRKRMRRTVRSRAFA